VIVGFMSEREIELLTAEAAKVPSGGCVVEVGSYLGKSTVAMAAAVKPNVMVWAVDMWDNRNMGKIEAKDTFPEFLKNTEEYRGSVIAYIRKPSVEAAATWTGEIDLLLIDADHTYEGALADLDGWVPHLKRGGVLIMHDYTEKAAGVAEAFAAFRVTCPRPMRMKVVESCLRVEV